MFADPLVAVDTEERSGVRGVTDLTLDTRSICVFQLL